MPIDERDPRHNTAEEVSDMLHTTANVARQAIMTDDADMKKSLKAAVVSLLKSAIKKVEESIDASLALDEEDE